MFVIVNSKFYGEAIVYLTSSSYTHTNKQHKHSKEMV